ncbi:MAG: IS5 family transposase [Verrucomicrobia bacterium]|nr:IS5 family transposase [Verrucomicrobiota bacterium]
MRGGDSNQGAMFSYVSLEDRVPADHPLRVVRRLVDGALHELSPRFAAMYSDEGRPSIAPERLLRALLLQAFYTVRSERQLVQQLDYNLLFRWFVGLGIDDEVWNASTFSKNRERLLRSDIAAGFLAAVLRQACAEGLLSAEHFTVDGTLVEAWASFKSFQPKADAGASDNSQGRHPSSDSTRGGRNEEVNFHGQRRANDTHASKTDPEARLYRKGQGKEAKLSYMGHVLMENRNGLVVDTRLTTACGTAERDAAIEMIAEVPGTHRISVGADKAYDSQGFVDTIRVVGAVPHVAQNDTRRRSSIDARTTRHVGYRISQRVRKRVEEIFGWIKTIGGLRKTRHKGTRRVGWMWTFVAAAYNLIRIRNLLTAVAP